MTECLFCFLFQMYLPDNDTFKKKKKKTGDIVKTQTW